jgi:hypothetical protein
VPIRSLAAAFVESYYIVFAVAFGVVGLFIASAAIALFIGGITDYVQWQLGGQLKPGFATGFGVVAASMVASIGAWLMLTNHVLIGLPNTQISRGEKTALGLAAIFPIVVTMGIVIWRIS